MKKGVLLLFIVLTGIFSLQAQISEHVFSSDYKINPENKEHLLLEFNSVSFFKNNEFEGKLLKGYTLPGFWMQPKAVYYPTETIKLELGIHGLIYWGARKYPNYAYQDIAKWEGNQYTTGVHLLPFFRAQMTLSDQVDIVLGNIYGGANHRLIEPLYSPELNLTADPETGLQLLYHSQIVEMDTWVNWQSFIFNLDTHQEAFTFGTSSRIKFNQPKSDVHFYMPIQGLAQHRGGEIDTLFTNSVQTFMNGSIGIGTQWNTNKPVLKNINAEIDLTGYYQQAGKLWPLNSGSGFYARISADVSDFRIKTSYWKCNNFISMFGSAFYGTVSTSEENTTYNKPEMVYLGLEYTKSFGKGYSLGIDIDLYHHLPATLNTPEGILKQGSASSFSAGIYFRATPSFLLKNFGH